MPVLIGIDLGLAYSSIAVARGGEIQTIPDDHGCLRIPTSHLLSGQGPETTDDTGDSLADSPGVHVYDTSIAARLESLADERITTAVLKRLKALAEAFLAERVEDVVITVPASNCDVQREATRAAGRDAGWNVLRLLNAPTAAAIAHWVDRGEEYDYSLQALDPLLVLDIGASHADATLLEVCDGLFEVKSSAGDSRLGGRQYDERLFQHFVSQLQPKSHMNCTSAADVLRQKCEQAKISLSIAEEAQLDVNVTLRRSEFENICDGLFRSTLGLVQKVLQYTKLDKADMKIVLVGGSAKIPKLRRMIADLFGRSPGELFYPDLACLRGASLHAASLSDNSFPYTLLVLDIVPHPVQLGLVPDFLIQVFPRNTVVPRESTICVTLDSFEHLPRYTLLFAGPLTEDGLVGKFDLSCLWSRSVSGRRQEIRVDVAIDVDGILMASLVAVDTETGIRIPIPLEKGRPMTTG
ncbi:hypothetical protein EYZ11_013005 [Aspergillus tanneri]|uniref:Actin-like ATPase domain-containing protein n=1 Tax=Aspergillus tanneri TaxID=1220188 RepID=A0A4S3IYS4_9EURO|nr:uncharacterized protein ATNIH1004_001880 [Aspergillus tanneri]KAA8641415.1 hypothetical protein ATNIH1004_001880 [Aspergillus tanneri]THC87550.1 hypothetical protein EYZ11_013005 [Aspergillus tanneri]